MASPLLASLFSTDVVVVAKDTDVLVLLVWAYAKYNVPRKWYFKYEADKFADVGAICDYFGRDIASALPAFHSITGCDTTSYFFRAGKCRMFKKVVKEKSPPSLWTRPTNSNL